MLTRDGVIARYIFAFCFFFASGSGMVTGWIAAFCGIMGTVELATALMQYSPVYEAYSLYKAKKRKKVAE